MSPNAPSGLAAGSATSSSLTLTWTDNSSNETGFKIERSTSPSSGFTQIATVGANVTSYTSTGLSASTVYFYNVRAYNAVGDSAYANTASGQTLPGAVVPPNAPSGLATGSATSSSLTLTWTDNSSNETGFKIEYSASSMVPFTQIATVGPNVTTYVVTGLSASTVYRFRVRAYNTAGDSDYSNTASGSPTAGSQTVTLAAVASNCVSSFNLDPAVANTVTPNCYPTVGIWSMSNSGGDYSNTIAYASAVQFNTSSLSGKTIESATLNLEARSPPVGYYQRNFRIGAIASSWSASTLTWNKMKSFAYQPASWMSFSHPIFSGQDYPINLKAIVQNWANGTYSNYGIGFESVDYTMLWNWDSLDQYDFYIPTLTVTYH